MTSPSVLACSSNHVNFCTFNARSLRNKIAELSLFTKTHKIHVLAVCETWLGDLDTDMSIALPGFQAPFRKDRKTKGGGVCVYISDQIAGTLRSDLNHPDLEVLWVEVKPNPKRSLLVGCCYRPPQCDRSFYDYLEATLDKVADQDIILMGDFNAKNEKWYSGDKTTSHGVALKELSDHFNFAQLCHKPSHLNNAGKPESLLDVIFTNVPEYFPEPATTMPPISTSDHLPVVVECSITKKPNHQSPGRDVTKWHYFLKDRQKMDNAFLYDDWEHVFQPYNDINEIWNRWKQSFFKDIETFIPRSTKNQIIAPRHHGSQTISGTSSVAKIDSSKEPLPLGILTIGRVTALQGMKAQELYAEQNKPTSASKPTSSPTEIALHPDGGRWQEISAD